MQKAVARIDGRLMGLTGEALGSSRLTFHGWPLRYVGTMSEHDLEKLLGGFAADTLTPEEKQALYSHCAAKPATVQRAGR